MSKFVGLILVSCLASGALSGRARAAEQVTPTDLPRTDFATAETVKPPMIRFDLTGSRAALKASLWAVHLLKPSSGDSVIPQALQDNSAFAVTGPFTERSAGIRLQYDF